jgi:membrane fusion protein, multidrug efflux system
MPVIRIVVLSLLLFTAAIASAGCSTADDTAAAPAAGAGGRGGAPDAVPVATASVVQKSMPVEIKVIGSAEAYSTVGIRAQTTGQLMAVNFKEGEDVTRGQVLFSLDRRPLEAALQAAQANLERDLAQAANAAVQAKRYQDLADRGIATREQLDTSRTAVDALNATVQADRAALENAQLQLQFATISAPISGRTGALMVNEGNLVRANDTMPLVVINQVSPLYVSFAIPEAQLPELRRYMAQGSLRVTVTPPNDESAPAVGQIAFIDNAVDQNTGTIRIKGTFPNSDRRLWPGQFVNVVVTLTTDPDAIVAPATAVQDGQQGPYVFVVKPDQTVEMRPVIIERTSGAEIVIASGVEPGDTVVTDGHLRLVPGTRVSAKTGESQAVAP